MWRPSICPKPDIFRKSRIFSRKIAPFPRYFPGFDGFLDPPRANICGRGWNLSSFWNFGRNFDLFGKQSWFYPILWRILRPHSRSHHIMNSCIRTATHSKGISTIHLWSVSCTRYIYIYVSVRAMHAACCCCDAAALCYYEYNVVLHSRAASSSMIWYLSGIGIFTGQWAVASQFYSNKKTAHQPIMILWQQGIHCCCCCCSTWYLLAPL